MSDPAGGLEPDLPPGERATRVRWIVLGLLCALSAILYVDRICFGMALSSIKTDLGISDRAAGWLGVAFTIAYGVFEIPVGRWGDRIGPRRVLPRIVPDPELLTDHEGRDLGAELLPGVALRAERVAKVALEARLVTGPVAELMERGRVVAIAALELLALGKRDRVLLQAVGRPVSRTVLDGRARGLEDRLGPLVPLPLGRHLARLLRTEPLDLRAVRSPVTAINRCVSTETICGALTRPTRLASSAGIFSRSTT